MELPLVCPLPQKPPAKHRESGEETKWTSTTGLPKWKQSPIDLSPMYTLHQDFPPLLLMGHLSPKYPTKMTNTGKTVKIQWPTGKEPTLRGGPLLDEEYRFAEMQFRWGPSDARGAEHSIDGVWFSMEAQAIHCNTKYDCLDKCLEKEDGLAIVAFLFQVIGCEEMVDNEDFARLTDNLPQIRLPGQTIELLRGSQNWMRSACCDPGYYSYSGSLTAQPFAECVTWIILPRPVGISARQANAFRSLYGCDGEPLLRTFRSQQKIHKRKVFLATEE